jgi:DNA-directed RNA polymerase specialized sigma24 family protein
MDKRIRIIEAKAEKLRSAIEYSPPSLSGTGGGSSADRMPDTISKIVEYEQRAAELRTLYVEKYIEIDKTIRNVTNTMQREVLERRYLLYQKWQQIADEMNYSIQNIYILHRKGLQKIRLNYTV